MCLGPFLVLDYQLQASSFAPEERFL